MNEQLELCQYWDNTDMLPDILKSNMYTFQQIIPTRNYMLYNRETAAQYIKTHISTKAEQYFESFHDKLPAARSDMFRAAKVLTSGGSYHDASHNICNIPPGDLEKFYKNVLFPEYGLSLVCKTNRKGCFRISNSPLMSCEKYNKHMVVIWDNILKNIETKSFSDNVWSTTGPGVIHNYVVKKVGTPSEHEWKENTKYYIEKLKQEHGINLITRNEFKQYIKIRPTTRDRGHWSVVQKQLKSIYK